MNDAQPADNDAILPKESMCPKPSTPSSNTNQDSQSSQQTNARDSARKEPIPEVDDLLRQQRQLTGAVLLGTIPRKDADFILRNNKIMLDVLLKRSKTRESHPSQDALVDLCRRDPRAISAVEAFLTEEQLQLLMSQIAGDQDEQA